MPQGSLNTLTSMADQPSSTAAMKSKKKDGGRVKKLFRDLIKRPNDSVSQANLTPAVSVSSAIDAHDHVPGNDAGGTASSK